MTLRFFFRLSVAVAIVLLTFVSITSAQKSWVASWTTSPQEDSSENILSAAELRDGTLRQIVHLSLGGSQLRIRLSNRYGKEPLHILSAHIATAVAPGSAKIIVSSDKTLKFSGESNVTIPVGADCLSDAIQFPAAALSDLAITLRVDSPSNVLTGHPGSRATSFLASGDAVSSADFAEPKKITRWYFLSGVDVKVSTRDHSIVILGDSITDGHGATTDGNDRWPDVLAKRLQANPSTSVIGIANQGIGGNRLLLDGIAQNALARFDHDVLAQPGARFVIVFEGINDLGMLTHDKEVSESEHEKEVQRMIAAYQQMIERAHSRGMKVIGATLTPFMGFDFYHPNAKNEADRQAVNAWIRTHFDGVIDFDRAVRDPEHPEKLKAEFDCGDHLHPSPAGFAAMAGAVRLSLFLN
jgi:lysophospholipase L1-like esterase